MNLTKSSPWHVYFLAVLMGIATMFLWIGLQILFEFLVIPEGYRPISPIMMFQGAPLSHYQEEHAVAVWLHRATDSVPGLVGCGAFLLGLWLIWARVFIACPERDKKFLATAVASQIIILILNFPFTAITDFHHVGWGMPCNSQPIESFLGLNLILSPITIYLAGRSYEVRVEGRGELLVERGYPIHGDQSGREN